MAWQAALTLIGVAMFSGSFGACIIATFKGGK